MVRHEKQAPDAPARGLLNGIWHLELLALSVEQDMATNGMCATVDAQPDSRSCAHARRGRSESRSPLGQCLASAGPRQARAGEVPRGRS